jgi:hypothetical protein
MFAEKATPYCLQIYSFGEKKEKAIAEQDLCCKSDLSFRLVADWFRLFR